MIKKTFHFILDGFHFFFIEYPQDIKQFAFAQKTKKKVLSAFFFGILVLFTSIATVLLMEFSMCLQWIANSIDQYMDRVRDGFDDVSKPR